MFFIEEMQGLHSIGGGGRRLFGGVSGSNGGDRRLIPHNHTPPTMKCPRCESLNTKFCYYNNYNLSQPRHFCKNCQRYWTKGGVLRNVPVGGGCRKTKRSKSKSNNNSAERKSSNSQKSSSDSSSHSATTATTVNTTTIPVTNSALNFHETTTEFPKSVSRNPSFDPQFSSSNYSMFPEIGTFTSLITSSTTETPLEFNEISLLSGANQREWLDTEEAIGEDWNNGTDEALFDLAGIWNQNQWNDHQQLNYLR